MTKIPRGLEDGLRDGLVMPFVGAGVSISLAALNQPVGDRSLPVALGNLMAPDLRTAAFREIWRSPQSSRSDQLGRVLDKDVLEWLLEIGEKLPKEPE